MGVSYSQLQIYRRCPKQFEFAVVKKLGRAISRGESFGSSIHSALRRWGELEQLTSGGSADGKKQLTLFFDDPAPVPHALELQTLQTMLRECFISEGYASRTEMDAALAAGAKAVERFFEWWNKEPRTVIANEKGFKLSIDRPGGEDIVVSGRFDRIERTEKGLRIIDFKTSAPRSQAECDADLQLSIYALAAGTIWPDPVDELSLLFLSERGCTEVKTVRNEIQLEQAKDAIRALCVGIDVQDYAPLPSVPKCTQCPYRDICPASMSG